MIPTKRDLQALFEIYDVDGSNGIDYNEFASVLYDRPKTSSGGYGGKDGVRSPEELAEALRNKLVSRGSRGFIGLQR